MLLGWAYSSALAVLGGAALIEVDKVGAVQTQAGGKSD